MDALRETDPVRIGVHVLVARLGAGGMGQVYLGRSPGGRLVAVKVVREEILGHPQALARFRREASTVREVRSAYTARLIDASLERAPYWLATEYVAGPTLAHAVGARGALPAATCRALGAALAEGLASVHEQGVTHRDVKPQNVILGAQGPQLIDFGIARGVGVTMLTQEGQAPGTPGFTAPEVLLGGAGEAPADVFALGALLAYAATGRPPFGAGEAASVWYRTVHEPVDAAGVEAGLAALIEACVAKDPAARPSPAEVIRRCGVTRALVEDPVYAELVAEGPPRGASPSAPDAPTAPQPRPAGTRVLPDRGSELRPDPGPDAGREPRPEARPESRPESGPESRPESGPDPLPEARPEPRVEPQPEPLPESLLESRPEPLLESRPGYGLEFQPELHPEPGPESGLHPLSVFRPESRPASRREPGLESRPESLPESRPGYGLEPRPESRPEPPAESGPGSRPGPLSGAGSGPVSEGRADPVEDTTAYVAPASPRKRRPGVWLAVGVALAVAGSVAYWQFPPGGGGSGLSGPGGAGASTEARSPGAKTPGAAAKKAGPPADHLEQSRTSRERWTLDKDPAMAKYGSGLCNELAGEESAPGTGMESSTVSSSTNGVPAATMTVKMRAKGAGDPDRGPRPAPYYVSVAVKPPSLLASGALGPTSVPVDLYESWDSGEYLDLSYPTQFRSYADGKGSRPPALASDRGDWTVVFYHVEDDPKQYARIACSGFRVG
ncbi:protein kinase [Streptomyces sp. NPDC002138]|uniref:protein kinase domain-containing protein n=1 Tax=Streptomyces sp. NPDC002138 TaxID=3154410 RepID=UPI0033276A5B